ncbi:malonyl-coenzyme:anthocyanin 5-O-glucoside-6'''-O-malonyltransferase-like [Diospyros lotus]|uniref:malonyl-coenzyme:anthocyanin 5-O-glucoside-6'''-O-malonyltransferase-like n=1 Tax=Diospyros lotus TaxID=55363 RepID=UPI0022549133|nr:malonyl-coenzyme:anthocyanin 5-O-glucoside-6'''-O-malonyltransferase-like [Diospyros lotus]
MASSPQKVLKVLEEWKISPPQGSVPSTTLPLTFFDIPWLLVPPSQPLFFFPLATTAATFTHSILPTLKLSLSIALQRFFPLAGNLSAPPQPSKPQLTYCLGDSVSLTVAESNADFVHLSGHHPRAAHEVHRLAPPLPLPSSLLAVQITVFPVSGVCIGFALRHVAADGRTFHNFLKAWASIHRLGLGLDSLSPSLNPSLDRLVIRDPNLLEAVLLKQWWSLRSSQGHFMADRGVSSEDMVRATFVMGRPEMDKLKHLILIRSKKLFGSDPLYLSPYVIACAVIWVCLTKVNGGGSPEEPHYFGFIAGGITRLGYSVPVNYLGNCVSFGRSTAQGAELVGKDGIVVAAKAIGDTVKRLNGAVLGGAESWISDWKEMFGSELHVMVTGSPKLDLYGLDFGWGGPKKIEEISIDRTGAVSLARSTGLEGGIEIGLALPTAKMEAFSSLFNCF